MCAEGDRQRLGAGPEGPAHKHTLTAEAWDAGTRGAEPPSFPPPSNMGKVRLALPRSWENSGWPPGRPNPSPGPENPSANVCAWGPETEGPRGPKLEEGAVAAGQGDPTMSMIWLQNSCRMTMILEGVM